MVQEIPDSILLTQVGQKAVIVRDGKVLMCRGPGSDLWDIPGGRIHKDEEPRAGLARELREELGVEATIGDPIEVCVEQMTSTGFPRYFILFKCILPADAAFTLAADEIEEVRWMTDAEVAVAPTWPGWSELLRTCLARVTS